MAPFGAVPCVPDCAEESNSDHSDEAHVPRETCPQEPPFALRKLLCAVSRETTEESPRTALMGRSPLGRERAGARPHDPCPNTHRSPMLRGSPRNHVPQTHRVVATGRDREFVSTRARPWKLARALHGANAEQGDGMSLDRAAGRVHSPCVECTRPAMPSLGMALAREVTSRAPSCSASTCATDRDRRAP